jgi:hypothetical protein
LASEKQIAANKRNAAKSTGPRTSGGKARSRLNALRHGAASRILFEQNFVDRHLNGGTAAMLNLKLEPICKQKLILLADLDAAVSAGKPAAVKKLLRRLIVLERRELEIR